MVISPDLGRAVVDAEVVAAVMDPAEALVEAAGLARVDIPVKVPDLGLEWALAGLAEIRHDLGDAYPECADDLTPQIAFGLRMAEQMYDLKARVRIEATRTAMNETMADLFDKVDFVFTPTVADVAFGKTGPFPTVFNGVEAGPGNNGALTIPSNIYGNPAISIPAGTVRGLPVGLQVLAPHHREAELLDLALIAERELMWPPTAPGAPI